MNEGLAVLNLPSVIHTQAEKLLQAIHSSRTIPDTLRAVDRVEGFTLGVETVGALRADTIEGLYLVFDDAAQTRLTQLT